MPSIISVNDVKLVLGLTGPSSELYPDAVIEQVIDAAEQALIPFITVAAVDNPPAAVKEATLAVTIDIWQSRQAPGGNMNAADFTPGPYRMGRSLLSKVSGLLGPYYLDNWQVG